MKVNSGYKIKVKQNIIIKTPVFIKHFISDGDKNLFLKYKIKFEVSKNSKVTIINEENFLINQCINIEFDLFFFLYCSILSSFFWCEKKGNTN